MRNYKRENTELPCGISFDKRVMYGSMLNFSRTGAMVSTNQFLSNKKYVSIMYQNEKNQRVRLLTYVVHCVKKGKHFVSGLQFVSIEER